MSYTTQMDAARQGIITPEMEIVAAKESMDVELLRNILRYDMLLFHVIRIILLLIQVVLVQC